MLSTEIKEKLDKALETVNKKRLTIEGHKKQAVKKLQVLKDNGWEYGDPVDYKGNSEAYWAKCEYGDKMADIRLAEKKLQEAEEVAERWRVKLEEQLERESLLEKEVPDVFKQARQELSRNWGASYISERDRMLKLRKTTPYKEFRKIYKYSDEDRLNRSDAELIRQAEREADVWLLDLYNRVKNLVGEITDVTGVVWGGKGLDGIIVGTKGRAKVFTVDAGGYNIQKWHLRTLVKLV